MAQRILARQNKDMKQIVMITDGKTQRTYSLPDGRILQERLRPRPSSHPPRPSKK